ncbi:MAG TPA: OmpH family outer membrane protein [Cytophagaceae bacterium]|jgi:outer membrane protein|nr:OmpH family outer membrane protein [Cytophagaceae bacterium]
MRFLIIGIALLFSGYGIASAQKFGFIDADIILKQMPEYAKAENELSELSAGWEKEIGKMKAELDKMNADYKNEEILLTDDMKKERQAAIADKEKALKDFQRKTFGFDGLIFAKRQELMKPVQDKLYSAVEKVAKAKQLQVIFDRSSDLVMIYSNPIHDYTDYVLDELGLGDKNDTIQK